VVIPASGGFEENVEREVAPDGVSQRKRATAAVAARLISGALVAGVGPDAKVGANPCLSYEPGGFSGLLPPLQPIGKSGPAP